MRMACQNILPGAARSTSVPTICNPWRRGHDDPIWANTNRRAKSSPNFRWARARQAHCRDHRPRFRRGEVGSFRRANSNVPHRQREGFKEDKTFRRTPLKRTALKTMRHSRVTSGADWLAVLTTWLNILWRVIQLRAVQAARGTSRAVFRGYRDTIPICPAAWAAHAHPAGRRERWQGIYFKRQNAWELVRWKDGLEDAAVVITSYNSHTKAFCRN